jgi:two-component system, chemotaxis family, response regulator Rcp1
MKNEFKCVLFIDDDKLNNVFNMRIANKYKAFKDVLSFTGGKEALNYLIKAFQNIELKPDIIFLDLNMPGMNGWEFIQEYEKIDPNFTNDIKVFLLTTSSNPDDYQRSKTIPAINDYLSKPLTLDTLEKIIPKHYNTNFDENLN